MAPTSKKAVVQTPDNIIMSFPPSLRPYAELMRIHRSLGFYLNTTPYWIGIAYSASIGTDISVATILHRTALLSIWSFFLRCGGCVWNDLIDLDLDREISRTKSRPLPRGAVSPQAAALFAVALFACGSSTLFFLPSECIIEAVIIILAALFYPFGKRLTDYPQLTLANIGWAIPMTMHSFGLDLSDWITPTVCMFLFIATVIIMIDFIYSCQDTEEDVKVGVKSMAVRFKDYVSLVAFSLLYTSTALFASVGWLIGLGLPFFIISVGGHFFGFRKLLKATEAGKSAGVETSAKKSCFLASMLWLLGFGIEYSLRV